LVIRKDVGRIIFTLGIINIPVICFYFFMGMALSGLSYNSRPEYFVILPSITWGVVGLSSIVAGDQLAKSDKNVVKKPSILGWILFFIGIIAVAGFAYLIYLIVCNNGYKVAFAIMVYEVIYCVFLSIAGWLLSHPLKKESSSKSK
jgi:hypothetical protein